MKWFSFRLSERSKQQIRYYFRGSCLKSSAVGLAWLPSLSYYMEACRQKDDGLHRSARSAASAIVRRLSTRAYRLSFEEITVQGAAFVSVRSSISATRAA